MKYIIILSLLLNTLFAQKVVFEVLGSGGPEINGRASSSYIVWIDDKARLLIDTGSGSMLRFEQSGAKLEDLEAIVLTHLHIDHSVDLPSYMKAGYFSNRVERLAIIGPSANAYFPNIAEFLERLFGDKGAYSYMNDILTPQSDSFQIYPIEIDSTDIVVKKFKDFTLKMTNVKHGNVPAIALRVNVEDVSIVVSGDTNNENASLEKLIKGADLFVAHHAIAENAQGYATKLHMKPSMIAKVAQEGSVKRILLTHRMKRTLNNEAKTLEIIHKISKAKVIFAEDRMRVVLP